MKPRRGDAALPKLPLELAYPLEVRWGGMEGAAILDELPPRAALTVLKALRLVTAWTRDPDAGSAVRRKDVSRWEIEVLESGLDEHLWAPLASIANALNRPTRTQSRAIANCFFALCDWALEREAEGTALLFAEAAALAWPENARYAWVAGRLLRNHGRFDAAQIWLHRSARIAVWNRDWMTQDLALNSLGNLCEYQGRYEESDRLLSRALAAARRHRMKDREAAVTHDLLMLSIALGGSARAEKTALRALDLYGAEHPNLPKLAHDLAKLWITQGRYTTALAMLSALEPRFQLPDERVRLLASITRASGASGDQPTHEAARGEALEIARNPPSTLRVTLAWPLLDMGLGAGSIGDWSAATEILKLSLAYAREFGNRDAVEIAELALGSVANRTRVETPISSGRAAVSSRLAESLARSLEINFPLGRAAYELPGRAGEH